MIKECPNPTCPSLGSKEFVLKDGTFGHSAELARKLDEYSFYPPVIKKHLPTIKHETYPSERSSIVGQLEFDNWHKVYN